MKLIKLTEYLKRNKSNDEYETIVVDDVIVNLDKIICFEISEKKTTTLYLSGGIVKEVQENPDKIMALIKEVSNE